MNLKKIRRVKGALTNFYSNLASGLFQIQHSRLIMRQKFYFYHRSIKIDYIPLLLWQLTIKSGRFSHRCSATRAVSLEWRLINP